MGHKLNNVNKYRPIHNHHKNNHKNSRYIRNDRDITKDIPNEERINHGKLHNSTTFDMPDMYCSIKMFYLQFDQTYRPIKIILKRDGIYIKVF
eukprot:UN34382